MTLTSITTGMEKGPEAIDANFKTLDGSSVVELTTSDTSFADQTKLTKQSNGVFAAFNGYKAIYYG